jgi:Secretion system C-terminal sorting domain
MKKFAFLATAFLATTNLQARDIVYNIIDRSYDYINAIDRKTYNENAVVGDVIVFTNNMGTDIGIRPPNQPMFGDPEVKTYENIPNFPRFLARGETFRYTIVDTRMTDINFILDNHPYVGQLAGVDVNTTRNPTVNFNNLLRLTFPVALSTKSINEVFNAPLAISPNPASSYFSIEGLQGKSQVTIYDAKAQLVNQHEISAQDKVDVQAYQNGTYFILVDDGKTKRKLKFIKQ